MKNLGIRKSQKLARGELVERTREERYGLEVLGIFKVGEDVCGLCMGQQQSQLTHQAKTLDGLTGTTEVSHEKSEKRVREAVYSGMYIVALNRAY
uniref:Uncharacterized protein n=1 Tax=Cannabis sativa TaxID=3483 RepID=A0A803P3J4_CANSA